MISIDNIGALSCNQHTRLALIMQAARESVQIIHNMETGEWIIMPGQRQQWDNTASLYTNSLHCINCSEIYINCFAIYLFFFVIYQLFCNESAVLQYINCFEVYLLFCNISSGLQCTTVLKYIVNFSKLPHNTLTFHQNINCSDINTLLYQILHNISTTF